MNVLTVDIGGSHVKFRTQRRTEIIEIKSGRKMTPEGMMEAISQHTEALHFDHVSIGFPGTVIHDAPLSEPYNLGKGWVKFNYRKAFGHRPLRMLNDAALQALGSYKGGRMLFLGFGTGLGSALIVNGVVQAMELAHLPWKRGKTYEYFLGAAALKRDGRKNWLHQVTKAIEQLEAALASEYVVLGGGNAKLVKGLPKHVSLGVNENVFKGGFMLWKLAHKASC